MHRLINRLKTGKPLPFAWCGFADPRYIDVVASYGFDAVLLDMQHGFYDESSVQDGIAAVAAKGKAPLVRIPVGRWDTASRAMDFGALGVVAPMVNNADDARAFAKSMKYIPRGERSFGPRQAASINGVSVPDYLKGIDDASLALAMIETREAVAAVEEIVSVDGIDGILIGPGDLSISLRQDRIPDAYGPDSMDAVKTILTAVKAAGKWATAYAQTPEDANMLAGLGFDMISIGEDGAYLDKGIAMHIDGIDFA
jgi:4-hydroxy-2-oxoheptanedioate aldolase